ncbi:MAG: hypothetical protein NVS9B10_28250 [Nevskia sp.]
MLADDSAARRPISHRPRPIRTLLTSLLLATAATAMANEDGDAAARHGELSIGGRTRTYSLHVPSSVAGRRDPLALVVALHGGGGNGDANEQQTGFNALADREGFIVVHPDGTGPARLLLNAFGKGRLYTWNAGSCCGYAVEHGIDDVAYLRALVKTLQQRYPIDPRRIYATGLSNGGMMSYRLACEASDVFAAIGVVSGAQTSAGCQPAQPVSVIHFHGTADQNVPLAGGIGAKALDKQAKPPVMDAINFWLRADGLAATPQISARGSIRKQVWSGGSGAEVVLYLIDGGGHAWPGGKQMLAMLDKPAQDLAATPLIWEFFKAHPKSSGS